MILQAKYHGRVSSQERVCLATFHQFHRHWQLEFGLELHVWDIRAHLKAKKTHLLDLHFGTQLSPERTSAPQLAARSFRGGLKAVAAATNWRANQR